MHPKRSLRGVVPLGPDLDLACVQPPTLHKKKSERSISDLPLVVVFWNNFAYMIK